MTTQTTSTRRCHRIELPTRKEPPRRRWVVVLLLALAAGLVFCHGCHRGDHDDEPVWIWLKARQRINEH